MFFVGGDIVGCFWVMNKLIFVTIFLFVSRAKTRISSENVDLEIHLAAFV